jgi:transposase InsO family protein
MKDRQAVLDELHKIEQLLSAPGLPRDDGYRENRDRLRGAEWLARWVLIDEWPPPSDLGEQ